LGKAGKERLSRHLDSLEIPLRADKLDLQPVIQHVPAARSVVLQFGATDCCVHEARTFCEGTLCQVHELDFARRLTRRAIATWIGEQDLLTKHVHRLRSRALLDNCLQGSLPILRDWRDSWRWIGGGRGDGGLSNWCRRRAGGLVLGRVDEDNEQKPDAQAD